MLANTLSRIPGYSVSFVSFLWSALVLPVLLYGLEIFHITAHDLQEPGQIETRSWRGLLKTGGRAPNDALQTLRDSHAHVIEVQA
eukprot:6482768-Karenia_brevis.AAC.1